MLTPPPHGSVSYSTSGKTVVAWDTKATITCDLGYELKGKQTLICMENGHWNGTIPTCELKGKKIIFGRNPINLAYLIVIFVDKVGNMEQHEMKTQNSISPIM